MQDLSVLEDVEMTSKTICNLRSFFVSLRSELEGGFEQEGKPSDREGHDL